MKKRTDIMRKVKKFRKQGLSYRQIAKILDKDLKSVYRWDKYELRTVLEEE